jgi:hypothetical protein
MISRRRALIALIPTLLVIIYCCWWASNFVNKANETAREAKIAATAARRTAARVASDEHETLVQTLVARKESCRGYNVDQFRIIVSLVTAAEINARSLAPMPRKPETQRKVDVYVREQTAAAVSGHRFRDCTAAGIAAYLGQPRPDPSP